MWLAIVSAVIVGGVSVVLIMKSKRINMILVGTGAILLSLILPLVISHIELNMPNYDVAKFETRIDNTRMMFNSYTYNEDGAAKLITIPSHYFLKIDWINHWEYCDTPTTIKYYGDMPMFSRYPLPEPEIIIGQECK